MHLFSLIVTRIVEKNPRKFKIDDFELKERRSFVERMKATVQVCCFALWDFSKYHKFVHVYKYIFTCPSIIFYVKSEPNHGVVAVYLLIS